MFSARAPLLLGIKKDDLSSPSPFLLPASTTNNNSNHRYSNGTNNNNMSQSHKNTKTNNNNSTKNKKSSSNSSSNNNQASLDELRAAITRMEALVEKAKRTMALISLRKKNRQQQQPPKKGDVVKGRVIRRLSLGGSSKDETNNDDDDDDDSPTVVPFDSMDEDEFVELLRRTAEIVVRGERAAFVDEKSNVRRDDDSDDVGHWALFEHFCERNGVALIVGVVTGRAFGNDDDETEEEEKEEEDGTTTPRRGRDGDDKRRRRRIHLPPLSIATQGVQSMAILVQNVSRTTSLYFLLSNNRVNDLIGLPLERYADAHSLVETATDDNNDDNATNDAFPLKRHDDRRKKRTKWKDSAEMNELATHFVSFLKTLAMRMNEETLQFFLSYPEETAGLVTVSSPHFSSGDAVVENGRHATAKRHESSSSSTADSNSKSITSVMNIKVDFPLYARALEFCSADHDPFVRVTAMNICLNTLRLATVTKRQQQMQMRQSNLSEEDDDDNTTPEATTDDANDERQPSSPTSSSSPPDTSLRNVSLPLRERLAIAHHVCSPSRVQELVGPIFSRLAQICGELEDVLRSLDEQTTTTAAAEKNEGGGSRRTVRTGRRGSGNGGSGGGGGGGVKEVAPADVVRMKTEAGVHNVVGDLQDELLLLDDVLKVGLISLNEQTIEMMLATFIYPLLLQPLLLYAQRHPRHYSNFDNNNSALSTTSTNNNNLTTTSSLSSSPHASQHPFTLKAVSDSLRQSGLLTGNNDSSSSSPPPATATSPSSPPTPSSIFLTPDAAPAKTALFALTSVFHSISNQHLLCLLFTSLLHPLAPDASGGIIVTSRPNVVSVTDDDCLVLRIDDNREDFDDDDEEMNRRYTFGRRAASSPPDSLPTTTTSENSERCIFVLAPTLAYILETGGIASSDPEDVQTRKSLGLRMRRNPYRRVLLSCLAGHDGNCGGGGLKDLQKLAVGAVDAAVSSVNGRGLNDVLFGTKKKGGGGGKRRMRGEEMLWGSGGAALSLCRNALGSATTGCGGITTSTSVGCGNDNMTLFDDDVDPGALSSTLHSLSPVISSNDNDTVAHPTTTSRLSSKDDIITYDDTPCNGVTLTHVIEIIASLCVSIITSSVCVNGVWRLDYDPIAAHALLGILTSDSSSSDDNLVAVDTASRLVDWRLRQSALFLAQLPPLIDTTGVETITEQMQRGSSCDGPKAIAEDLDEEQLDILMDRTFRDEFDDVSLDHHHARATTTTTDDNSHHAAVGCVIDALTLIRSSKDDDDDDDNNTADATAKVRSASARVGRKSNMNETCRLICEPRTSQTFLVSEDKQSTLQCAALSALAHLQLDALATLIRKKSGKTKTNNINTPKNNTTTKSKPQKTDFELDKKGYMIAPISPTMHSALFSDKDDRIHDKLFPQPGTVVSLVGKAAFPCVCEVSEMHKDFFTDETACVIADGVKWQSLYLVLYSRYMLLAEPEKGGTGGNGRIVTSCLLSHLRLEKDKSAYNPNLSTARRVLLKHSSIERTPPGVFSVDSSTSGSSEDDPTNTTTTYRQQQQQQTTTTKMRNVRHSHMDLWFEDKASADRAYDALLSRISKARSRRGKRLREALLRESHGR